MDWQSQRGTTLAEVVVAIGIAAIVVGAALAATAPAVHHLTEGAQSVALQEAADRELHVALDIAKYDGSTLAPNSIATTLPLPGASALPAQLQLTVTPANGALNVAVTASASDGSASATAQATVTSRAPQPGATIAPAQLVAQPTGAP